MTYGYSQTLYRSSLVNIGLFDCPIHATSFQNTGPVGGHLLAFPRTAVKIRHFQMKHAFVANPTITTLYNPLQEYERYPLSTYGDRCDWLSVCPTVVAEINRELKNASTRHEPLLPVAYTRCPSSTYRQFRQLIQYLHNHPKPEALFVEEIAISIVKAIMLSAQQSWGLTQRIKNSSTHERQLKWVMETNEFISTAYHQDLNLEQIARQVHCTPYHLCRVYKRYTGMTIYQHISHLRLHHALESLEHNTRDLTRLGANLGFSDHSHFSHKFRQAFGMTPSLYRRWSQHPTKLET